MLALGGVVSWFGLHEVGRLQETGRPPIEERTPSMSDDNSRLAVLIDADNTSPKLIKEMFEELAGYGTLTVKRAYGDWTNQHLTGWKDHLLANAISPQQQFAYTAGKNATDSALIIDAMDLLYSGNVEGFAIVSSDSDFTPLAMRLREAGKRVIGVGPAEDPEGVRGGVREVRVPRGAGARAARSPRRRRAEQGRPAATPIQSVLTKALNKVDADDDDWVSLGSLGNHLNRTDPSFDSRTYGFAKLGDLVKGQPFIETKTVTGASGRGQLWVRLKGRREDRADCAKRRRPRPSTDIRASRQTQRAAKKALRA